MLRSSTSSALPCSRHALSCTSSTRTYASKAAAASGSRKKAAQQVQRGSRPGEGQGDSRVDAIKQTLFESRPSEADRLAALSRAIPSPEAHETITRAWQLHLRQRRESHSAELARKYTAMRKAIDLLEATDKDLWKMATEGRKFQNVDQSRNGNERLEGIVPREYRVPTERPGSQLWDHEWKAPAQAAAKR
ncbi:hypothetical protein JCM8097_005707 [Rhodosporidiobolus ruineniae]